MFLQHSLIWNPILQWARACNTNICVALCPSFVFGNMRNLMCLPVIKCTIILHNWQTLKTLTTPFLLAIYTFYVLHNLSPTQSWFTLDSMVGYVTWLWQCQTRLCTMLYHYVVVIVVIVVIDWDWYKKKCVVDSTLFWPICWRENTALQCGIWGRTEICGFAENLLHRKNNWSLVFSLGIEEQPYLHLYFVFITFVITHD